MIFYYCQLILLLLDKGYKQDGVCNVYGGEHTLLMSYEINLWKEILICIL